MARTSPADSMIPDAVSMLHDSDTDSDFVEQVENEADEGGGRCVIAASEEGDGQFHNYMRVNLPPVRERPPAPVAPAAVPPALMDLVLGTSAVVTAQIKSAQSLLDGDMVQERDVDTGSGDSWGAERDVQGIGGRQTDTGEPATGLRTSESALLLKGSTFEVLPMEGCHNPQGCVQPTQPMQGQSEAADEFEREWRTLQAQREAAESATHAAVLHAASNAAAEAQKRLLVDDTLRVELSECLGFADVSSEPCLSAGKRPADVKQRAESDELEVEWMMMQRCGLPFADSSTSIAPEALIANSVPLATAVCAPSDRPIQSDLTSTDERSHTPGQDEASGRPRAQMIPLPDKSRSGQETNVRGGSDAGEMHASTMAASIRESISVGAVIVLDCDYDKVYLLSDHSLLICRFHAILVPENCRNMSSTSPQHL